jgi:nitroreductase
VPEPHSGREPAYPVDPQFTRRWSPRAFTGEAIPPAELLGCIEAARWAPSAFNAQPWRFVHARRDTPEWSPIFGALAEANQAWVVNASALVVVLSITQRVVPGKPAPQPIGTHAFDAGAAWASFAFQALRSGWHTHAMAGFDRERLRAAIGAPADCAIHAVVAIGRIADPSTLPENLRAREMPSGRHGLDAIASEGRWDFPG